MSLAARLDRLRGHRPELAVRRTMAKAANARASVDHLARVLGGERHGDLVLRNSRHTLPLDVSALTRLPDVHGERPRQWIYLDTETTGLSGGVGNLAFMVGLARYTDDGCLLVRQYALAGFSAEREMLADMLDWIGTDATLVSYNGKCFDVPLLQARCGLHRFDDKLAHHEHIDLMYLVRRGFRRHWSDCRLQTAERELLGLHRTDDLPGSLVPLAWQSWLRHGQTQQFAAALKHNLQDVVSLALLHERLVTVYAGESNLPVDATAIGKAWRDKGREQQARDIWERAGSQLSDNGRLQLAASYRRDGDWQRAERVWAQLFARGCQSAASELSKLYEHRRRELRQAYRYAMYCEPAERARRIARLQRKLDHGPQLPLFN